MYYAGQPPEGANEFETAFGLAPLGEGVSPERLARLETLLGLFISAAVDPGSRRAHLWAGSFAPVQEKVPVPSEGVLTEALNGFRALEEVTARQAAEYVDHND